MISKPVKISTLEIFCLLIRGSNIAVNKVSDESVTRVTETVDNLMDLKNRIQCAATIAPVKNSLKNASLDTRMVTFLYNK
jgi:hypothetical protein